MRRREFVMLVGGVASWSVAARAAQRVPRIAILMTTSENDVETQGRLLAFRNGLEALGWYAGRNLILEQRFAAGSPEQARAYAAELVAGAPDIILANGTAILAAFQQQTRTIPIVFVSVPDPVGDGFVESLSRPGNNLTGLTNFEFSMGGKWLQIIRELNPVVTRVALLFNPQTEAYTVRFLRAVRAANPARTELVEAAVMNASDVERTIAALANRPEQGLIVMPGLFTAGHHELIVNSANRFRLPAIYPFRYFVDKGGLISYGVVMQDLFRRAASFVDRILKGAKPADLPVQAPTKFELVINLKTAKTFGLTVPPTLLASADEIIE